MPDVPQLMMMMHGKSLVLKSAWCQSDYAAVPNTLERPILWHLSAGMA